MASVGNLRACLIRYCWPCSEKRDRAPFSSDGVLLTEYKRGSDAATHQERHLYSIVAAPSVFACVRSAVLIVFFLSGWFIFLPPSSLCPAVFGFCSRDETEEHLPIRGCDAARKVRGFGRKGVPGAAFFCFFDRRFGGEGGDRNDAQRGGKSSGPSTAALCFSMVPRYNGCYDLDTLGLRGRSERGTCLVAVLPPPHPPKRRKIGVHASNLLLFFAG